MPKIIRIKVTYHKETKNEGKFKVIFENLPAKYKTCLDKTYSEEVKIHRISAEVDLSSQSRDVCSTVQQAKNNIREVYKQLGYNIISIESNIIIE